MPTTTEALDWLERWDRQQEVYMADREERFVVIADVVAAVTARPDPLIVDLGAGPGSLSVRLVDRIPGATVVAVDADPLLLGLAATAYADRTRLRIVSHDLRDPGWVAALDLPRRPDAFVSTTALHWLTRDELAGLYQACGELIAPGGVLVDGDHLAEPAQRPRLDALLRQVSTARAERVAATRTDTADVEDWQAWWGSVDAAPELHDLVGERGARPLDHTVSVPPDLEDHTVLLREAGFGEVGTVWQYGNDRVLVALR